MTAHRQGCSFELGQNDENLQEQRDEVLALQSIFNSDEEENIKVLSEVDDAKTGLFTLLINVCVKPCDKAIQVDVNIPVGEGDDEEVQGAAAAVEHLPDSSGPPQLGRHVELSRSMSGNKWHGAFPVRFLPPLSLLVSFPPSYPSDDPPNFELACTWLRPTHIQALAGQLRLVWEESVSMPVVFSWMDWLENNTLSHLAITDHLVLKPSVPDWTEMESEPAEPEPMSEGLIPQEEDMGEIIASMIRYNRQQEDIEFCQTNHECQVCFDEKAGFQFFRMSDCHHHFCHDCMTAFCAMHVQEGTVEELRCPDVGCDCLVPPYIIQAVLGQEEYDRWENLLLQKTLDAMTDTVYCPRCGSLVIAEAEEDMHLAHCPVCYFAFCTECNRCWHQGRNCESEEDVLEQMQKRTERGGMSAAERKKYEELVRKMEEDIQAKAVVKKNTKSCPSCKVPVEKIGGCNKMTCKCGQIFCWLCGKKIVGYSHFTSSGCNLFPGMEVAVRQPVQRIPDAVLRMRARIELNPDLVNSQCRCPVCKQLNLKRDRDNHIKCWNCKSSFCFMCRGPIIGVKTAHFKGPCVQHS